MRNPIESRSQALSFIESNTAYLQQERTRAAYYIPRIRETTHRGETEWDVYSRLLKDRIVFVGTEIDDFIANAVIAQFLFLESEDPDKDIQLYVNSPGGVVTAGLAIIDTMNYVRCPVATMCIGQASSMGAVLLAMGNKGSRFALPNARIMIHQPLGGARGQASDIEIQAREIVLIRTRLNEILAEHTSQAIEKIAEDTDRDYWMNPEEALEYGLVDTVQHARNRTDSEL